MKKLIVEKIEFGKVFVTEKGKPLKAKIKDSTIILEKPIGTAKISISFTKEEINNHKNKKKKGKTK